MLQIMTYAVPRTMQLDAQGYVLVQHAFPRLLADREVGGVNLRNRLLLAVFAVLLQGAANVGFRMPWFVDHVVVCASVQLQRSFGCEQTVVVRQEALNRCGSVVASVLVLLTTPAVPLGEVSTQFNEPDHEIEVGLVRFQDQEAALHSHLMRLAMRRIHGIVVSREQEIDLPGQ